MSRQTVAVRIVQRMGRRARVYPRRVCRTGIAARVLRNASRGASHLRATSQTSSDLRRGGAMHRLRLRSGNVQPQRSSTAQHSSRAQHSRSGRRRQDGGMEIDSGPTCPQGIATSSQALHGATVAHPLTALSTAAQHRGSAKHHLRGGLGTAQQTGREAADPHLTKRRHADVVRAAQHRHGTEVSRKEAVERGLP